MPFKNDIYISYHWKTQENVKPLYEMLTSQHFKTWMGIQSCNSKFLSLQTESAKAITSSRVVICCITRAFSESANCCREMAYAYLLKKPLIVLMFENLKMQELGKIRFFFTQEDKISLFNASEKAWSEALRIEMIKKIEKYYNWKL